MIALVETGVGWQATGLLFVLALWAIPAAVMFAWFWWDKAQQSKADEWELIRQREEQQRALRGPRVVP